MAREVIVLCCLVAVALSQHWEQRPLPDSICYRSCSDSECGPWERCEGENGYGTCFQDWDGACEVAAKEKP
jgi:hypothetical protein